MISKTLYLFGNFGLFIKLDAYTLSGFEKLSLATQGAALC